jgi:multisubunit Na+/H+ antiporter MnhC subunit
MTIFFALLTNIFSQFLKGYVAKKWGATGVLVTVFIVSFVISIGWYFIKSSESLMVVFQQGLMILSASIALYEIILKRLSVDGIPLLKTTTIIKNE